VSFSSGDDESADAARTAQALQLDHSSERCTPAEMHEVFADGDRIAGDPLADPSLAPTWVVSRAARQRWTVALSGDGGDELLGGYPRLKLMAHLESWRRAPGALRAVVRLVLPARRWAAKLTAALACRGRGAPTRRCRGMAAAERRG
jgi:asparagine synthase (glutamine-hydrolysing)